MSLRKDNAIALTFCGSMAALGVVIMLVGGLVGVATYAAPLMASVCLMPMLYEFGRARAFMGFAVTALLTVLLCAEKELAFFYLFIGYYPLVRGLFGLIRSKLLRIAAKLLFFACMLFALYAFLLFVFRLETLIQEVGEAGRLMSLLFLAGLVLLMLAYDAALALAERIYFVRLRPRLKFLKK